eukprot:gene12395-biopygen12472
MDPGGVERSRMGSAGVGWSRLVGAGGSRWEQVGAGGSMWEHVGAGGSRLESVGIGGAVWSRWEQVDARGKRCSNTPGTPQTLTDLRRRNCAPGDPGDPRGSGGAAHAPRFLGGQGDGKMEESGGKMTEKTAVGGKWREVEESGGNVEENDGKNWRSHNVWVKWRENDGNIVGYLFTLGGHLATDTINDPQRTGLMSTLLGFTGPAGGDTQPTLYGLHPPPRSVFAWGGGLLSATLHRALVCGAA